MTRTQKHHRRGIRSLSLAAALVLTLAIPAVASSSNFGNWYHNGCAYTGSHTVSTSDRITSKTSSSTCDLVDAGHRIIYGGSGFTPTTGLKSSPAIVADDIDGHDWSQHRAKEGGNTDSWKYLS